MKCSCVSLLILIILINLTTGSENQVRRRLVPQVRQHQACTLVNRITLYENHSSTEDWLCELQDEDAANAGVRFVGIEGLDAGHLPLVQSGSTTIFVEGATLSQDKLIVPQGTRTEFGESQPLGLERKLAPGDGRRKVLAVWVTARDSNPTLTPQQLSDKIFGTINDSVNLKERMASCSYDELLIEPYVDNNVINGVIQVSLNQNVVSEDHENVRKNVVEAVGTLLGKQLPFAGLQHLMVCLPPGTLKESNPRWAAYGYVNHWLTTFNDRQCHMASTQAHEVGHNLGLQHASEVDPILGPDEYGDDTGLMGNGIFTDDAKLCYNPAKSWQLGWYSLRRKLLDFTQEGKFTGQLIGVNDYKHSSAEGKYVNIKIEHPGSNKEIYVGFNLATGINSETPEAPNLVTVQAQASNGHSWLLAKLDSGNNHQHKIPNFIGTGTLNIDVKSINLGASPPVADVEIFMEYTAECNDDSACKHLEACAIGTCQQGFCLYDTSTCPGNFLLQLATDTYPSELTWSVEDLCRDIPAVVLHGGPYWVPNSEIVELGTLGQSRFQFTMKDSKGNGLSNATSPATHFNVSFNGFPVMQIGDDFGFSATFEFGLKSCAQQLLGPITSSTMPITTTSPPPKAVAIRKATKSKAKKPKAAKKNAKKRTRQ